MKLRLEFNLKLSPELCPKESEDELNDCDRERRTLEHSHDLRLTLKSPPPLFKMLKRSERNPDHDEARYED